MSSALMHPKTLKQSDHGEKGGRKLISLMGQSMHHQVISVEKKKNDSLAMYSEIFPLSCHADSTTQSCASAFIFHLILRVCFGCFAHWHEASFSKLAHLAWSILHAQLEKLLSTHCKLPGLSSSLPCAVSHRVQASCMIEQSVCPFQKQPMWKTLWNWKDTIFFPLKTHGNPAKACAEIFMSWFESHQI